MPKIEWDPSFSVGNALLDEQHQKWIVIMNDLHDTLMEGDSDRLIKASKTTLDGMADYVRYHFSCEEEIMREHDYSDLATHQAIHEKFMGRIEKHQQDIDNGLCVLNSKIMRSMQKWLQEHILQEDKKYISDISPTRK